MLGKTSGFNVYDTKSVLPSTYEATVKGPRNCPELTFDMAGVKGLDSSAPWGLNLLVLLTLCFFRLRVQEQEQLE